jgi:hypothetical protein
MLMCCLKTRLSARSPITREDGEDLTSNCYRLVLNFYRLFLASIGCLLLMCWFY